MRAFFAIFSVVALAACSPPIPDSGAGVGFGSADDFRAAQAARDAALEGPTTEQDQTSVAVSTVPAASSLTPTATPVPATTDVAAAPTPERTRTGAISDEQNFDAVAERESIESDAARLATLSSQYQVVQPTALPTRASSGPNIVQYALETRNQVGQQQYRRNTLSSESRFLRNCADYASADLAQQDFLLRGGPTRDRRGIDPDGDGFACAWDPTPFRTAGN